MSFKSFLSTLWGDVESIVGIAATPATTLFSQLTPAEQAAAQWVSGAIAVINQNPSIEGSLLVPIIQSVFPNTDLTPLITLANSVGSGNTVTTVEDAIGVIQAYLKPKTGNVWITAVQGLVSLGATLVSPATPVQKFVAVGEYVYQDIVKSMLGIGSATPPATPVVSQVSIPNAVQQAAPGEPVPSGIVSGTVPAQTPFGQEGTNPPS
jgi:hypothetical protein